MLYTSKQSSRSGVILLVVMALLSLFAAVGIGFVIYAEMAATTSKYYRESHSITQVDVDPEFFMNYYLSQLIYDSENVYSALRGHSLARSLYGWMIDEPFTDTNGNGYWDGPAVVPPTGEPFADLNGDGLYTYGRNDTPFNGIGRIRNNMQVLGTLANVPPMTPQSDYQFINYSYFPADNFLRDPECLAPRASNLVAQAGPYVRTANVSYTYPDLNNMFLAVVNADGEVLMPSYHRPWLFGNAVNWTNPEGKYFTLASRAQDHDPSFPSPAFGPQVKNLDSSPGMRLNGTLVNNDSYWVDPGFPVMTAKDGTKFKIMAAAVVTDLDGKINANATGNTRGAQLNAMTMLPESVHASNHGLGPWEINLSRVLKQDWRNMFTGGSSVTGRYGADGLPATMGSSAPAWSGSAPPSWARVDLDGIDSTTLGVSSRMLLPGEAGNPNPVYLGFPSYSTTSYGNADATERDRHPLLYNPLKPSLGDTVVPTTQVEALSCYGRTGSSALRSAFFELSPLSFGDPGNPVASQRARRLITPDSFDLGRPGSSPFINNAAASGYAYNAAALPPQRRFASGAAQAFPGAVNGGEFGPDGGGIVSGVNGSNVTPGRLNINRVLTDYPAPDAMTGQITDMATFNQAQADRQAFARDIFNLLRWVTTGEGPNVAPTTGGAQLEACRWLAQIAVNIVDYRDSDDYMTPFAWNPATPMEFVWGTELTALVINEAYSEVQNHPDDITDGMNMIAISRPYQVNFWVELVNTTQSTVRLQVRDTAMVPNPLYGVYKVVIAETQPLGMPLFADELTGEPAGVELDVSRYEAIPAAPKMPADIDVVLPVPMSGYNGVSDSNQGFYLLGPETAFPAGPAPQPAAPTSSLRLLPSGPMNTNAMMHDVPNNTLPADFESHGIFLRRLACPHLPPSASNPYITVDYVRNVASWDALQYDLGGAHVPTPIANRHSKGRKQPNAAFFQVPQTPDRDAMAMGIDPYIDQPQHTFFRHNGIEENNGTSGATLRTPFDWLVHLDRFLTSPVELLHVNCFKPYEVTQHFVAGGTITDASNMAMMPIEITTSGPHGLRTGAVVDIAGVNGNTAANGAWTITVVDATKFTLDTSTPSGNYSDGGIWSGQRFAHQAPWIEESTRLYRLFEYLDTAYRAAGVSYDGRIPGKININTADWYKDSTYYETAQAVADPQTSSVFQDNANFQTTFQQLMQSRLGADGVFSDDDRPVRSNAMGNFVAGQHPNGSGIADTLLRPGNNGRLALEVDVGSDHPWHRYALLSKMFNNVTTRSNAFAVWVTFGFFEVADENARPVRLGGEIGYQQNRHIRHRMFAIIDRSQLRIRLIDQNDTTKQTEYSWLTPNLTANVANTIAAPQGIAPAWPTAIDLNNDTINDALRYEMTNGRYWVLQPGATLVIDAGLPNEETVVVTAVDTAAKTVTFTPQQTHAAGQGAIVIRGNMGPWQEASVANANPPRYDMRKDREVVRFVTVIK